MRKNNPALIKRNIYISHQLTEACKLILALNGAAITILFAFIISNYAVLPQIATSYLERCQTLFYLSDAISKGAGLIGWFAVSAMFASIGIIIPRAIRYRYLYSIAGNGLEKLNQNYLLKTVDWQIIFTVLSWLCFYI